MVSKFRHLATSSVRYQAEHLSSRVATRGYAAGTKTCASEAPAKVVSQHLPDKAESLSSCSAWGNPKSQLLAGTFRPCQMEGGAGELICIRNVENRSLAVAGLILTLLMICVN